MHHYQHHIGDYDAATVHLSWDEDLAYTRLLRVYYRDESPIPADLDQAARLIRVDTKARKIAMQAVLNEFFTLTEDGWINKRCEVEIGKFQEKSHKAKSSANERWSKSRRNANAYANAMLTANRQPLTNKTPLPPKGGSPKTAGISLSDLSDPEAIQRWMNRRSKALGLRNDHETWTWLNAAAIRAAEHGDDPVALFLSLAKEIASGETSKIEAYYDRAKLRMRETTPGASLAETNGVEHVQ